MKVRRVPVASPLRDGVTPWRTFNLISSMQGAFAEGAVFLKVDVADTPLSW